VGWVGSLVKIFNFSTWYGSGRSSDGLDWAGSKNWTNGQLWEGHNHQDHMQASKPKLRRTVPIACRRRTTEVAAGCRRFNSRVNFQTEQLFQIPLFSVESWVVDLLRVVSSYLRHKCQSQDRARSALRGLRPRPNSPLKIDIVRVNTASGTELPVLYHRRVCYCRGTARRACHSKCCQLVHKYTNNPSDKTCNRRMTFKYTLCAHTCMLKRPTVVYVDNTWWRP